MATIAAFLTRAWLVLTLAVTGVTSALPAQVHAVIPSGTPAPQPSTAAYPKLQQAWEREQSAYERLGRFFDAIDQRNSRGQVLIDKARASGKEVSGLQAALDSFRTAVKQARPVYEGIRGIVVSHQGFDDTGNVVDAIKAFQTVLEMRAKLTAIRALILPPARALRQAIMEFRQANPPAAIPTP